MDAGIEEAEEWVDLLNSTGARDLAGRMVSEQIANRFSIDSYKLGLQQFVKDVISSKTASGATE